MKATRRRVEIDPAKRVVINLITSSDFCREVRDAIDFEFFRAKPVRTLAKWALDYYDKHNKAPKQDIEQYYDAEKQHMEEDDSKVIENILTHLSDIYDQHPNSVDFITTKAFEFFRERQLELTESAIRFHRTNGDLAKAEEILSQYMQVSPELSAVSFIGDKSLQEKALALEWQVEREDIFFKAEGRLGDFLGPMQRGELVAFLGPTKRGKTFFLLEMALNAALDGKKVLFISLEMSEEEIKRRFDKRITGVAHIDGDPQQHLIPVFDCKANQEGSCSELMRLGAGTVVDDQGNVKPYADEPDWVSCNECRNFKSQLKKRKARKIEEKEQRKKFKPAVWLTQINKGEQSEKKARLKIEKFFKYFKSQLKYTFALKHYVIGSASRKDILNTLIELEYSHNFIADVIVVDYADLLKPEKKRDALRHEMSDTWLSLKRLADERRALVITAGQANREAAGKKHIQHTNSAESEAKNHHVNGLFGLNQLVEEKQMKYIRISKTLAREGEAIYTQDCYVLQDLAFGQGHLDSEF